MSTTNFDLAPPAKIVDGLTAVPIDIQSISASLTFDGATSTGAGDATLAFTMAPQAGNPIFDLRQTITAAWLDGAPIPTSSLAHHNFGGGTQADLRVIESVLAANSSHTLRVTYALGSPQASTAGSYLPAMTWAGGPRLAFNFGFTDLGAGRYLEAWVPANLLFDQFTLTLQLRIVGTGVPHSIITNGTVTNLGPNHWSVVFPNRFTAHSPLLELRATDTLQLATDTTTLPVSGKTITIEAWKLITNAVNLGAQIASLKTWLAANETENGVYLHGNKFVAFLNVGGMEYDGGTTTGAGSLRHEAFHSWWGRGIRPASQPDGWWDEAWTVYHDEGANGTTPIDFTDPPVDLCPRNPWIRVTNPRAYSDGERFFEGVASLLGVASLRGLMRQFFDRRNTRPATTADLEAFLVAKSGEPQLVDAFHRFVFGLADPSPVPDLWIRDDVGHTGANVWGGRFWDSPDLWIRNADDGGLTHQPVEYGQDNWFHARVRNRSTTATARHFVVTFNVKPFTGIEFGYPMDFLPCTAAAVGFYLAPGASTVLKARWPRELVPPAGTHACWLTSVLSRLDRPAGLHVWEHNNLAQKNLTIVDLAPDAWIVLPIVVNRLPALQRRASVLEIVRPKEWEKLEVSLLQRSGVVGGLPIIGKPQPARDREPPVDEELTDCGGRPPTGDTYEVADWTSDTTGRAARQFAEATEIQLDPGPVASIPLPVKALGQMNIGLRLRVPKTAKRGDVITVDFLRRTVDGKRALGGVAVQIRVK